MRLMMPDFNRDRQAYTTSSEGSTFLIPADRLRQFWQSHQQLLWALGALVALRWLLLALFLLNVLPLDLRDPVYRWYLQHGGDQDQIFSLAQSIIAGTPENSVVGIGQALVMIPWILLLDPLAYIEIAAPLVFINGFVLGGISVLLIGGAAYALTRRYAIALIATITWVLLPLILYVVWFWHPEAVIVRSSIVPKMSWLVGLSDPPATFFLLLVLFLLAVMTNSVQQPFWPMLAVGGGLGLALIFRVHAAFMILPLLLYIGLDHGWHALLTASGGMLFTYLPQAWYNQGVFGVPFTTGYISYGDVTHFGSPLYRPLADIIANLPFSPQHLVTTLDYFISRRAWMLLPLLVGGLALLGVTVLVRRTYGWSAALLLLLAPVIYLLFMLMAFNFRLDIFRLSMPALPGLIIAGGIAACVLWDMGQRRFAHSEQ